MEDRVPDEHSWPTEDDDAAELDAHEPPTLQVKRPSVEQSTMRIPVGQVRPGPSTPDAPRRPDGGQQNLRGPGGMARVPVVPQLTPPPLPQPPPASPLRPGPRFGGPSNGQNGQNGSSRGEQRPAQPGRGQAGHGQPGHGQAGHGQAGHGQAGHGQAGHGQPGQGQQGQGQPGQGQQGSGPARPIAQPPGGTLSQASPPGGPPASIFPRDTDNSGSSAAHQAQSAQSAQAPQSLHQGQSPQQAQSAHQPQATQAMPTRPSPAPVDEPEEEHAEPERFDPVKSKRRKPLAVIGVLAAVGVLAAGAVFAYQEFAGPAGVTTQPPKPPIAVQPMVKAVDAKAPAPSASGLSRALAGPAASGLLSPLVGSVVDPATNTVLWQQGDTTPNTPASSLKILTAAAALLSLDRTDQLSTKVVAGPTPGSVVLVGGGDVTLSSKPAGTPTVYPGAATLDDLATQVKGKGPVTQVFVDLSRYAGDAMAPGWEPADIPGGSIAPMVPIMMDGARADPAKVVSQRSGTPAQAVADAFAQRLGVASATVGTAPANAQVLGEVKSAPLEQLVDNLMQISDNLLAEAVAREVARVTGNEQSFAGGAKATKEVLAKNGFDVTGVEIVDASGLSARNKVPAKLLSDVLAVAAKPGLDDQRTAKLRPLLTALPVAGGTGTLVERYQQAAKGGKGWVRAKTGTLTGVNSLAGVVVDKDGRLLVFAFITNNTGNTDEVRQALDVLAATLRGCGCS